MLRHSLEWGCCPWPWPCPGYFYKKAKKSHRQTQEKKHKSKHRAKDKKKAIPQPNPRAEHHTHQIKLPEAQGQETQQVEKSLASIHAVANFGSSTPSPIMSGYPHYRTPLDPGWSTSDDPTYRLGYSIPAVPSPRESSSVSDQKRRPRRPSCTGSAIPPSEKYNVALPATVVEGGPDGTMYVHPRSMAHAHFLVLNYANQCRPSPEVYSALIPTGGQVSDLVAALAPEHAGVALWARTDTGLHVLQGTHPSPLASGSLYSLHGKTCQLEVWPKDAGQKKKKTPPPPPAAAAAAPTTTTMAAAERVKKLEKDLEEAKKKEREEAKKKEREEAKKKAARHSSRRASMAYPAASGSAGETSDRHGSGYKNWDLSSGSPTFRGQW